MAIEYKNSLKNITTTGSDQVVYTCPTSTSLLKFMAIVKGFTIYNTTGGAGTVDIKVVDTSAGVTARIVKHFTASDFTTKATVNAVSEGPIVLESADVLKIDTSVAANVLVNVMEISDELRGV
jgi:MinD superfamily P-loop ATPase|tara:strand:+ start:3730 stop:4098 length:369 start_codon:yes stop_codon:yes gene_type:complete